MTKSLLSILLERVILARINHHLETEQIIPHEQFGFKPGHSTVHQLARISEMLKCGFLVGKSTGMMLLDVEKAYESVWQDAVVYKHFRSNLQPFLVKIVRTNRSFTVTVNDERSSVYNIPFDVPQGSVLSPTFYNILTSDVPMIDGVSYAFFADDTANLASDKDPKIVVTHLQAAQNNLEEFQRKWRIKHVNYIIEKVDRSTKALYSLLNQQSKLSIENKTLVVKCIIRPLLTSAVWGNCAKTHRKRLQVKQNKLLKMVHYLDPWYPNEDLHKLAGVDIIDAGI